LLVNVALSQVSEVESDCGQDPEIGPWIVQMKSIAAQNGFLTANTVLESLNATGFLRRERSWLFGKSPSAHNEKHSDVVSSQQVQAQLDNCVAEVEHIHKHMALSLPAEYFFLENDADEIIKLNASLGPKADANYRAFFEAQKQDTAVPQKKKRRTSKGGASAAEPCIPEWHACHKKMWESFGMKAQYGEYSWMLEPHLIQRYDKSNMFWSLPDRERDMVRIADLYRPLEDDQELAEEFMDLCPLAFSTCVVVVCL